MKLPFENKKYLYLTFIIALVVIALFFLVAIKQIKKDAANKTTHSITTSSIGVSTTLSEQKGGGPTSTLDTDLVKVEAMIASSSGSTFIVDGNTVSTLNPNWKLDSSSLSSDDKIAIFTAFDLTGQRFVVLKVDLEKSNDIVELSSFPIIHFTEKNEDYFRKFPSTINIPLEKRRTGIIWEYVPSTVNISPDNTKVLVRPIGTAINRAVIDLDGESIDISKIPDGVEIFWFSNSKLAFGGRSYSGATYDYPHYQIYDIYTKDIDSTKLPIGGGFGGLKPRINPEATAFVSYDIVSNSGWYCGTNIAQAVVRTYPEGDEIFTLDNLHEIDYRWLHNGELEFSYIRAPNYKELGAKSAPKPTPVDCFTEEEIMKYTLPNAN